MSDVAPSKPLRIDPESKGDKMPATELHSAKSSSSKFNSAPLRIADTSVMAVSGLFKSYGKGAVQVPVLKGVDLEIEEGGFTAIIGQSGSGKSTLLHLLGTLDAPDSGEIYFRDQRIDNLAPRQQEHLRNREFGLIFQFYHLLPELTTLENVLIPRMVQDGFFRYLKNKRSYRKRAIELLEMVGLSHRLTHKPSQLSGGEMQRTAIARSLISDPSILLADEPTGNLDSENGAEVMETLTALRKHENLTVVMVTHDDQLASQADRIIHLVNGVVAT
ncbi:MAG: ABC transporter ATP-binding protein [Mariniblastus sp.]|nr:ABC transporter ATP-binding protein [Mariniblastus sp.]MDG2182306.1 ABC transporter ATP-binding protein [Mariniblastus sp.]